jgi:hypothetical protein
MVLQECYEANSTFQQTQRPREAMLREVVAERDELAARLRAMLDDPDREIALDDDLFWYCAELAAIVRVLRPVTDPDFDPSFPEKWGSATVVLTSMLMRNYATWEARLGGLSNPNLTEFERQRLLVESSKSLAGLAMMVARVHSRLQAAAADEEAGQGFPPARFERSDSMAQIGQEEQNETEEETNAG